MLRVLVVDDDPGALEYTSSVLSRGHEVVPCGSGEDALRELRLRTFDLVVADLTMPPPDGFDVLRAAQALTPPPPVIVITALDTAQTAMQALRLGARDYLVKPACAEEIERAVARSGFAPAPQPGAEADHGLVGSSPAMRRIRQLIPLLARSRETVLILGETGTGKELLARALHRHSPSQAGPFVAHNMAATPSELTESIFFGHLRGSFSGAHADHAGLFEQADGGTLFLDEVDSFPPALQAKLLRVLECGCVQRVGSSAERPMNVRVLAACSVNPAELVARGTFRADLYYRLRQLEVEMPPLRDRIEDIPDLARHFLDELAQQGGARAQLSVPALEMLQSYFWPGNCRELRSALRSAALLSVGGTILPAHLRCGIQRGAEAGATPLGPVTLQAAEGEHIVRTLGRVGGNRSLAARLLGIDRGTLARKLRALGLEKKA